MPNIPDYTTTKLTYIANTYLYISTPNPDYKVVSKGNRGEKIEVGAAAKEKFGYLEEKKR